MRNMQFVRCGFGATLVALIICSISFSSSSTELIWAHAGVGTGIIVCFFIAASQLRGINRGDKDRVITSVLMAGLLGALAFDMFIIKDIQFLYAPYGSVRIMFFTAPLCAVLIFIYLAHIMETVGVIYRRSASAPADFGDRQ